MRAAYSVGVVLTGRDFHFEAPFASAFLILDEERHVGGFFPSPGSTLFLLVVLLLFSGRQPALHAPLQSNIAPIEELAKDLSEVDALMAASEVLSKS